VIGFVWNFFTWIPSYSVGPLGACIGVFDVVLSVLLFIGIGYQSTYVPATNLPCREASTWQGKPMNQSFWSILANETVFTTEEGESYKSSAQDYCKSYVAVFWVSIVVA
jgi:hypothetical protein